MQKALKGSGSCLCLHIFRATVLCILLTGSQTFIYLEGGGGLKTHRVDERQAPTGGSKANAADLS